MSRIDKNTANVGVDESVFMFGACASFAGYLVCEQYVMQSTDRGCVLCNGAPGPTEQGLRR